MATGLTRVGIRNFCASEIVARVWTSSWAEPPGSGPPNALGAGVKLKLNDEDEEDNGAVRLELELEINDDDDDDDDDDGGRGGGRRGGAVLGHLPAAESNACA